MRALVLLLLIASATPAVRAQEVAFSGTLSDSVVVTASRLVDDLRTTGRRITVWTAADIAALPVTSVDELLRTVGGVETQSRGAFGIQSDITMRGSSFDGVVLLLDGTRISDPQTGHFLSNLPIPLSEVARIEVLRGPGSAVYGPDAIGGVIHIFTRAGLLETEADPGITAALTAGRHGTIQADASIRTSAAGAAVGAASTVQRSSGEPIREARGDIIRSTWGDVRTDFSRHAHTGSLAGRVGSASVFARAGYDGRDFGSWHYYTPFASDTARSDSRTAWAQVRLRSSEAGARSGYALHLSTRFQESTYTYNPVTTPNSHTNQVSNLLLEARHQAGPSTALVGGFSAAMMGINSNSMGDHSDVTAGAFLHARWQAASSLTINASGRLDYAEGFGVEATPQMSLAYNLKSVALRAGAARAVRAPTYTERYYDTERNNPTGNLGNPNLDAEKSWSVEAGSDWYFDSGSLHGTVFQRWSSSLIDYARIEGGDPFFLAQNVHSVETTGLELDGELFRWMGETRLRLATSYSFLDSRMRRPASVEFKYALTHARQLLQLNASASRGRFGLGVQGLWKERQDETRYSVVDARATARTGTASFPATLSLELRNIFDRDYSEIFNAPMPGRWWLFGLILSL